MRALGRHLICGLAALMSLSIYEIRGPYEHREIFPFTVTEAGENFEFKLE